MGEQRVVDHMQGKKVEIEVIKLGYSDFREFLGEFYDPEKKEFPKDLAEWVATRFLEKCGFKVIKIFTPTSAHWAEQNYEEFEKLYHDSMRGNLRELVGVPDLFVHGSNEKFFVEVKSDDDALRINQLDWILKHPEFKVKLILVEAWWRWIEKFREEMGVDQIRINPRSRSWPPSRSSTHAGSKSSGPSG